MCRISGKTGTSRANNNSISSSTMYLHRNLEEEQRRLDNLLVEAGEIEALLANEQRAVTSEVY